MKRLVLIYILTSISFGTYASELLKGVSVAITESQYSAVIIPISYSTKEIVGAHESIAVIQAKVLTPIRGQFPNLLFFTVVSEIGDSLGEIGEPILIAFCGGNNEFYFTGVGGSFNPAIEVVEHAKLVVNQLRDKQPQYEYCN